MFDFNHKSSPLRMHNSFIQKQVFICVKTLMLIVTVNSTTNFICCLRNLINEQFELKRPKNIGIIITIVVIRI